MNNMNPFFWFFLQNMANFGGNMNNFIPRNNINQMNNFNNFNNFNNQNAMPFRKFNSENIAQKLNINDLDREIEIYFNFINSQKFKIKAKPKEKLIDVINRFKNNECPQALKNSLSICLIHAEIADQKKTLFELGVKNGEQILFTNNNSKENKENKNKVKIEFIFTKREKEFIKLLRLEYDEKYLHKELNKKLNLNNSNDGNEADNEEDIPTFSQFCSKKDEVLGIDVKEHKHKLVFCLTNISWKCNICNLKYKKEVSKYYCSLCDYSMCKNCHFQKKYFMKKSFPKEAKPSNDSVNIHFLDTDYHEHRLVFCRSSRHFICYNSWFCNNCRESFENDKWSFYCTICDFDLCCDCCGYH